LYVRLFPPHGSADIAQGDFDAVAYQAFSVTRIATLGTSKPPDWNPADDGRAIEAELRRGRQLVILDVSRPWLWLFKPVSAESVGQDVGEMPAIDGYQLQRKRHSRFYCPYADKIQANKLGR
jgi:mediator of RNA polymerase II transcription subunit 13